MLTKLEKRWQNTSALDRHAMKRAQERMDDLTKPPGSLGRLEETVVRLSGMTSRVVPSITRAAAIIFAADHGVSEESVSAYGREVTEEMVVNMCMGTAVSSVLARNQGVSLTVVDVGVRNTVRHPKAMVRKVAAGTQNFTKGPAMSREEAFEAVQVGIEVADQLIDSGHDVLVVGEMGIGNTTAASAMLTCMLAKPPAEVVGRGTGIGDDQLLHKQAVISLAIEVNQPAADDPWDVMGKLGGFEIAALAGAVIAGASRRVPVVLDGLMTGTAALWATRLNAVIGDYLIASHVSTEPAHRYVLQELGLRPMLDLHLGLGEGSGGLFALSLLQNACKVMAETATFEDARVTNPHRKTPLTGPSAGTIVHQDLQAVRGGGAAAVVPDAGLRDADIVTSSPMELDFTDAERAAVYKAIMARRDIRVFLPDPVPTEVLSRILEAGHNGPSVGYMQPWNFIVVKNRDTLKRLQQVVERERVIASEHYQDMKKEFYLRLKVEGIIQAPVTFCVTNDPTRGGPHVLGRNTIPETDLMSTACAIENMWLAARAEGVAVGWVSIYQKQDIRDILNIPDHVDPVALLTVGYTPHFPEIPVMERVGWGSRLPLETIVFYDSWEQTNATENFGTKDAQSDIDVESAADRQRRGAGEERD